MNQDNRFMLIIDAVIMQLFFTAKVFNVLGGMARGRDPPQRALV